MTTMMRPRVLCSRAAASFVSLLIFLSLFQVLLAAPSVHHTRGGGSSKHDDDGELMMTAAADVVVDSLDNVRMVQVSSPSTTQSQRSAVVEHFFQASYKNQEEASEQLRLDIHNRATNLTDYLITTRRTLHRHPELMYQEQETSAIIQEKLRDLDIKYSTGWAINTHPDKIEGKGGYGIVADIGTGGEPCVLLRADMDALPILERTEGIDHFKSRYDGTMHACGHDAHTTMLLGAAAALKQVEDSLQGTVRVMFQPAEEGGAGAKRMREEGVLEMEPKPQHAFGMHVWPT
jgi:hypothetical protein